MKQIYLALIGALAVAAPVHADTLTCDASGYKAATGLTAAITPETVTLSWSGDPQQEVRMRMGVNGGVPTIQELAIKKGTGAWGVLASNVTPEFRIVSGVRRMSTQQASPLENLGVELTPEIIEYNKWDPFWDAPLDVPGTTGNRSMGLPRLPSEIHRDTATYQASRCVVKTDGARIEVTFPGAHVGVFDGDLVFTVFRGTNLIRQELVASTKETSVAYEYDGGLKGLDIAAGNRVLWRDQAGSWQENRFGGAKNDSEVPLKVQNRLLITERGSAGSIAVFPPPHTFFWPRETAINLGYLWYRKDSATSYSFGVRQAEKEESVQYKGNFALYSAPPGTKQRMAVFLYPTPQTGEANYESALAFTHGDKYKPVAGYQVMNHHYHMDLGRRLLEAGSLDAQIPDLRVLRALGINIVSQLSGGGGGAGGGGDTFPEGARYRGPGPLQPSADPARPTGRGAVPTGAAGGGRGAAPAGAAGTGNAAAPPAQPAGGGRQGPDALTVRNASIEGARRNSDSTFLVMASQEAGGNYLGGHTDLLFSHPTYWLDGRAPGQALVENNPKYGKVYHIGTAADLMEMARLEGVIVSVPHPRTKGSTGFPDAVKDLPPFNDVQYNGVGFRWGMGLDLSETRLCDRRCLTLLDDMNNWVANKPLAPKYILAISEVRFQNFGDEIFGGSPVSYVKLDRLPSADDTSPVIQALQRGDSYVTSGEVLLSSYAVRGSGDARTIAADVEWTFPLDFVEVVWGDGTKTDRQVISTKDLAPMSNHRFEIPFNAAGKAWVRFAAWDAAGNGVMSQPTKLNASRQSDAGR